MEAQETYTVSEAAQYLGVKSDDLYYAMEIGKLQRLATQKGPHKIAHQELLRCKEAYLDKRNKAKPIVKKTQVIIPAHVEPSKQLEPPKEVKKQDDGPLLQRVLSSVFSFLSQHSFPIGLRSLEEVDASLRLWVVKTPETNLSIVASGEQVTVLSQEYQGRLEHRVEKLEQELRQAKISLAILKGVPEIVPLSDDEHPLMASISPHPDGYLVTCTPYPIAATGKDKSEALAACRRVLWGYTKWLHLHAEKLSPELRKQFEELKRVLMEK